MSLEPLHIVLGALSGSLVGLTLGLFGGGGSILAVPLLVYLVGVTNPHVAIGTSAFAVGISAAGSLVSHARQSNVKWRCAGVFTAAGIAGALAGSTLGKTVDGQRLLFLFALPMLAVGALMFRTRSDAGDPNAECSMRTAPKLFGYGAMTGLFSGFLGIGGGFLVVPSLVAATGMPMLEAIASSLVAVAAFGLATSFNYAAAGLVDWPLAGIFIAGGLAGGLLGAGLARRLSRKEGLLKSAFATLIILAALGMMWKNAVVIAG